MNKARLRLTVLVAALAVLLGGLIGGVAAKYIWSTELSGKITFSAKLAEKVELLEHEAIRNTDGSYVLGAETVTSNAYTLLPGVDVPKDPYLRVTGKTPIAAYLFLEVKEALDPAYLSYTVDPALWTKLTVSGANGGTVYVYKTLLDGDFADGSVSILNPQQITVSQKLKFTSPTNALTFWGLMAEASAIEQGTMTYEAHAAAVYTEFTQTAP